MPSFQQLQNPIYKNTSNIPRPQIDRFLHDPRDSAGSALARALKVGGGVIGKKVKEKKASQQAYEDEMRMSRAQLGLKDMNSRASKGGLSLLMDDFEPDAYDMKKGELAGTEAAGKLRDLYMEQGVHENADPAGFNTWLHQNAADGLAAAKAKGKSYELAYMKALGKSVEVMAKTYAGHTEKVIQRDSQRMAKERLKTAREADRYVTQQHELGNWMKGFLHTESAGNFNAWFGNAGNKEDLGQLDLGEILKRQARPGNDAAGLIQIVPSTLKHVMKKYGYTNDMKFTPQLQMEMGLLLMKEKGLDKWLRNEIPDGVMANRLASVWAGLKTSSGKGVYDGDGVNKGHQGHEVTVRQLAELRGLMKANPQLSAWIQKKEPKAGETAKILGPTNSNVPSGVEVGKVLEDVEGTGVDHKQLRDQYSDVIIDDIESGKVDLADVDDEIKQSKLNAEQAERVRTAAAMKEAQVTYEAKQQEREDVKSIDTLIRTGEGLNEVRKVAPKLAQRIMTLKTGLGDTNIDLKAQQENSAAYKKSANYRDPDFTENTIKEYLTGNIDDVTYKSVMKEYEAEQKALVYTSIPAFSDTLDGLEGTLPPNVKGLFRRQVSMVIADMTKGDETPDVSTMLDAVDRVAQRLAGIANGDVLKRMSRPEYNIEG